MTERRVRESAVVVAMKPELSTPEVDGVRYQTWLLPEPDEAGFVTLRFAVAAAP